MKKYDKEISELKGMGYDKVYVWDAEPNEEDPNHSHAFNTRLVILSGEILVKIGKKRTTLKSGDMIDIPKRVAHYASVGAGGCKYIVAERH